MATTSLIPATKDALVALLSVHEALRNTRVDRNPPHGDTLPQELVHIAGTTTGTQEYAVLRAGRKPRNESFTVTVVFDTVQPAARTSEEAETRLFEMYAALQDVVAEDPTLGIDAQSFQASVGEHREVVDFIEHGAAGHLEADVNVTARLN